jgi:hypothetical protein
MFGVLISSPPICLPRATYTAVVKFHAGHIKGTVDVGIRGFGGRKTFASVRALAPDAGGTVSMAFKVPKLCDDVQLTISSNGSASGRFQEVTITTTGRIPRSQSIFAQALTVCGRQRHPARTAAVSADTVAPELVSNIGHILKLDLNEVPSSDLLLDHVMKLNLDSLVRLHPTALVHRMTLDEARDFISSRFAREVVSAFDALRPPAYKQDLARYCWLYAQGGLTANRTVRFVSPLYIPEGRTVAYFRDARPVNGVLWAVSPEIVYSAPHQSEIELVIGHIVANARAGSYGYSGASPTGAELLGRVLAASYRAGSYLAGEEVAMTPGLTKDNSCFLGPDGKLVAVRVHEAGIKLISTAICAAEPTEDLRRTRTAYQ